jgi:hypothetical protein
MSCNVSSEVPMSMSMPVGKSAVVTDTNAAPLEMPSSSYSGGNSLEPVPAYEGLLQSGPNVSPPPSVQQPGQYTPAPLPASSVGQPDLADPSATQDLHSRSRYQMPAQYSRENPQYRTADQDPQRATSTPGLIGPIGYDVEK